MILSSVILDNCGAFPYSLATFKYLITSIKIQPTEPGCSEATFLAKASEFVVRYHIASSLYLLQYNPRAIALLAFTFMPLDMVLDGI